MLNPELEEVVLLTVLIMPVAIGLPSMIRRLGSLGTLCLLLSIRCLVLVEAVCLGYGEKSRKSRSSVSVFINSFYYFDKLYF